MYLTKEKVQELQCAKIDVVQELQGTRIDAKLTKFAVLFAKRFPQVQELHDKRIDEKIEKFARLFPNGTEVTRRLCELYPDVFNFGALGSLLIPNCDQKDYDGKIRKAYANYMGMRTSHRLRYYNLELALIFYEASTQAGLRDPT